MFIIISFLLKSFFPAHMQVKVEAMPVSLAATNSVELGDEIILVS
jgi:hypothetical protein